MLCYKTDILKFFGFEKVSVMFHDAARDQLYAIAFGDYEDQH
jgi:hypothetical protein